MQKITFSFIAFLFFSLSLQAQLLLDVCGDGWIQKRLIVGNNLDDNLFIGHNAGILTVPNNNTEMGVHNTFVGSQTGKNNTTGYYNVFLGTFAGIANTTGFRNTFIGAGSAFRNTTGSYNTFIGNQSGSDNTTGQDNTFIGFGAGSNNTIGKNNVFLGSNAGFNNTDAEDNVFLGSNAGRNNTIGEFNVFIGRRAGLENTTSNSNTFIGAFSGQRNIADFNTFVGTGTGQNTTIGARNTFIGYWTGINNISGGHNTFIGYFAGGQNRSGVENTFLGHLAGAQNRKGTRNTYLGFESDAIASADSLDKSIAIGHNAKVGCHNCAVIGGTGTNAVKVGIATSNPLSDLHIKQSLDTIPAGIRIERASNANQWTTYVDKFNDYNFTYNNKLIAWIDDAGIVGSLDFANQTSTSRSRKTRIKELGRVLDKVNKLQPLSFTKENSAKKQNIWGFNNEEVSKLFPTITPEKNEQKGIIYDYLGILSIKAIQELSLLVEDQQSEITEREELIEDQQSAIEDLQADVAELKTLLEKVLSKETKTSLQSATIEEAVLGQNLPNPFNTSTRIPYTIPTTTQKANILINGISGKLIKTIAINSFGEGALELQTAGLSKGQYTYSLEVDGRLVETKQMQLVR